MAQTLLDQFQQAPGAGSQLLFRECINFAYPARIITLHPFTITNVNCTPAISNVGGRPCVSLAGAGAATDGSNFCTAVAGFLPVAGKQLRFGFTWRAADATNHAFACGLTTLTTGLVAALASGGSPPANYFCISKLATVAAFTLRCAKASGTEETVALNFTPADATWYSFEVVVTPDASTAGAGRVQVYVSAAGGAPSPVLDTSIGRAIPDTVQTCWAFGMREGDSGSDATVVGQVWIEQAA